jgi:hypothetical protein
MVAQSIQSVTPACMVEWPFLFCRFSAQGGARERPTRLKDL